MLMRNIQRLTLFVGLILLDFCTLFQFASSMAPQVTDGSSRVADDPDSIGLATILVETEAKISYAASEGRPLMENRALQMSYTEKHR